MTNYEQAKQQIKELILESQLTFGDIAQLSGFCTKHLENLVCKSDTVFRESHAGGERDAT